MTEKELVLVTGGTGFIAVHTILQLLTRGYRVRATLRNMERQDEVRAMLTHGGLQNLDNLTFIQADLTKDDNWHEAMLGVTYVMHIASSTPSSTDQSEEGMIRPAVEGTLRVLKAAKKAGVKRVVMTSAFGAVGMGDENNGQPYTEENWSQLDTGVLINPYQKSKTLSERAAWEYVTNEGAGLEFAAINPVGVMGPILGQDYSHSNQSIRQMLTGEMKAVPKITSGYIDVRDVASLHILAMERAEANGKRFLATTGETLSMLDVAKILKKHLGAQAKRVPTTEIPNWTLKLAAKKDDSLKMLATLLDKNMKTSNEKAVTMLGWQPRSAEESILATATSLIELGLLD